MTIDFTIQHLKEVLSDLEKFEANAFPAEMKLSEGEKAMLKNSKDGFAVVGREGATIVCSAYMVGSMEAEPILIQSDAEFKGSADTAYLYSITVSPDHQNLGLGLRLLGFSMIEAKKRGYTYTCAHVRTRFGWNREWHDVFGVLESRVVPHFWQDAGEGVEYLKSLN